MLSCRSSSRSKSSVIVRRGFAEQRSAKVETLINDICHNLTLVEASQLVEGLKETLQIPDEALYGGGGAAIDPSMLAGLAAPAEEAEAEPEEEEQVAFKVILKAFDAKKKIKVIKEVRALCDLGLKEAKALVESAPTAIKENLAKDVAEEYIAKINEIGGECELE